MQLHHPMLNPHKGADEGENHHGEGDQTGGERTAIEHDKGFHGVSMPRFAGFTLHFSTVRSE